MTNETDILSEADEIAALLPWYVSGKISASDKARVDAYVKAHPEVLRQIELAREEADIVFSDNQAIAPPRAALDKLHEAIAKEPRARLHAVKTSFLDRVGHWLGGLTPRQLAYAGVAAALALAVQTASIGALMQKQGGFQTASGQSENLDKGSFALVALQTAAPAGTLSAFLAEKGYAIVEGPKSGGIYRVKVSDRALATAEMEALVAALKERKDLFSFASAAPQMP